MSAMVIRKLAFLFAIVTSTQTFATDVYRVWTDSRGNKLTAHLTIRLGDKVRLVKPNGDSVTVAIAKLSAADQEYLHQRWEVKTEDDSAKVQDPVPARPQANDEHAQLTRLRRDNAALRLQVRKLESQVAALERIIGAFNANPQAADPPPAVRTPQPTPVVPRGVRLYAGVGDGHWIREVSDDGGIVTLEDGSVWKVDSLSRIDTNLWLPTEDIVVTENSDGISPFILVNKDNGETAGVELLSP